MAQLTPSHRDHAAALTASAAVWDLLRARSGATSAFDPDYRRFGALIEALGGPEYVLDQWQNIQREAAGDLFPVDEVRPALARAARVTEEWAGQGRNVLVLGEPSYPASLAEVADAPPFLFVEGECDVLHSYAVAIVGARKASEDGKRRARRAAQVMVEAGITVISGLALGIDAAAHEATLDAAGRTVAVMGTPIDRRYPAANAGLADRIKESGGALLSEFHPGAATQPWHFLRRNRTMSGLVAATIVVEASETSGARSQAYAALEQGRLVFLPSSLVSSHDWARTLVERGRHGLRAIVVDRPEQVVRVLKGQVELVEPDTLY